MYLCIYVLCFYHIFIYACMYVMYIYIIHIYKKRYIVKLYSYMDYEMVHTYYLGIMYCIHFDRFKSHILSIFPAVPHDIILDLHR